MPNSHELPQQWWKRGLFLLVKLIAFIAIATCFTIVLSELLLPIYLTRIDLELDAYIKEWVIVLIAVFAASYIINLFLRQFKLSLLGFTSKRLGYSLLIGLGLGSSILLLCFLFLLAGPWVQIVDVHFTPALFFGWLLFFLIQPLAEEIIMRSFLQTQIQYYFGVHAGLVFTALAFGAMHVANDAFTWIAGAEIVLGGFLMGMLYVMTKSIWAPFAFHAIWNFLQSTVLGFAVSGMDTYRLLELDIHGPAWLTGGQFGLEGSILSLLLLGCAIGYFWKNIPPQTEQEVDDLIVVKNNVN